MKITDALIAEHGELYTTFRFVEDAAKKVDTGKLQLLGCLLECLLSAHAESEESFLFTALDHTLEEKGQRNRIQQAHQELDCRFKEAQRATDPVQARRIIKDAIEASRKHFKYEEEIIFPLAEAVLKPETLESLGAALFEQRRKS